MDTNMKSLKLQVLFFIISLFVLADALDDDYYDDLIGPFYPTDTNFKETYSALAARLNCSQLLVSHKGVKIEETLSDSIYKPTPAPFEDDDYFSLEVTEEHGNFTQSPTDYEYQDYIVQFNIVENSTITDYLDYSSMSEENHTDITENVNDRQRDNYTLSYKEDESNIFPKIDDRSDSKNESTPPDCSFAYRDTGDKYNWFQIISESGGIPGKVNATKLTPNVTEVLEPCHRPVNSTSPPLEDLLYEYESIEFKKFYRRERAFLRFAGTQSEFIDIIGQLVWGPPNQDLWFYRLSYHKDDTGFYVYILRRQKCVFEKDPLRVDCHLVKDFSMCTGIGRKISPGLQASLLG